MRLLFVLFIALSMVSIGWAGELFYTTSGSEIYAVPNIMITNPKGKSATIDFSGDQVTFSGELPVDEAAKVFFEHVGALQRDGTFERINEIIIKWTTTSRTYEESCPDCTTVQTVVRYPTCNQTGQKYEVTYAVITWKGKQMKFELEREAIKHEPLYRSVACADSGWPMNSWFESR